MDKLRAIEYFVCAAREGSLSAAARRLDVTVSAVSRLLASLERSLGARLFDRGNNGLTLTAAGQQYLEACGPALEQIAAAATAVGSARTQATGTVSIAVQHLVAAHCIAPALPRFHGRHPGIQLDLRDYVRGPSTDTEEADLRIALVWDEVPDEVVRVLGRTRMLVCASPQYWSRHDIPQRPRDLEQHRCLAIRAVRGTLMDHWPFERGGESEAAVVRGWLTTSNTNRDAAVTAALAGEGVIRSVDIAIEDHLRTGRLVPVLRDWNAVDSPLVRLMYKPSAIRLARVRVVTEFLVELFRDIERRFSDLVGPRPASTMPPWAGPRAWRRASAAQGRR